MKNCKLVLAVAASLALLSSCNTASVKGSFNGVPSGKALVVKSFDKANVLTTVDSVKIAADGKFSYKAQVAAGQPDFFYFYYGDTKVASLLLSKGDKVSVCCDTLGLWSVEGSADCQTLLDNEKEIAALVGRGTISVKEYIDFYRSKVKFVMGNSHSLTVVPVLYSQLGDTPVFGRLADAAIFASVADSLETVYPESKYVKILRNDAQQRRNAMDINAMIQTAQQASYIDLNFDGMEGKPVVLSDLVNSKKATMLVFWSAAESTNKMFNQEVLKPLYDKYESKGLGIYQVSLGADKATWAMVVREQNMPWINVCDVYARSVNAYGLTEFPTVFFLQEGVDMARAESITRSALDATLAGLLK